MKIAIADMNGEHEGSFLILRGTYHFDCLRKITKSFAIWKKYRIFATNILKTNI